jgi:toxin ParE1/3/4
MAAYSLSSKAAADLEGIHEFTIATFGLEQARAYLTGLHKRFDSLAQNPALGRAASELSPGLRRLV